MRPSGESALVQLTLTEEVDDAEVSDYADDADDVDGFDDLDDLDDRLACGNGGYTGDGCSGAYDAIPMSGDRNGRAARAEEPGPVARRTAHAVPHCSPRRPNATFRHPANVG